MSGLFRSIRTAAACLAALGLIVSTVAPAAADMLATPVGPVILEVDGVIDRHNHGGRARFDRAMLRAVGEAEIVTTTAWTDGVKTFRGAPAADVLALVGAKGETVRAVALNDYSVEIPIADFARYGVLLAMEMDGKRLSVREKGPIWIVYPRDDFSELQNDRYNERWIWQLKRLSVR